MLNKYCDFGGIHYTQSPCTFAQFYFISDHKILLELFRCVSFAKRLFFCFFFLQLPHFLLYGLCCFECKNASIKSPPFDSVCAHCLINKIKTLIFDYTHAHGRRIEGRCNGIIDIN